MGTSEKARCVACDRDDMETPLIRLDFRGAPFWICPQHLPILIHSPQKLAGKLPGAEDMQPSGHHHH